jgi:acetylornithine/N-succinyldiaminopimelate aminotransferase
MTNANANTLVPHLTHEAQDPLAPVFAQYPLEVLRGEGVWLIGADGRRVLDLYGGHAVAALGYGHPAWTRAVAEQARSVNFQSNAVPMDVRLRAARRLIAFSQLPVQSVFFVNSGAEANENALKMAFTMNPGRTEVVALEQSFHGRTAGAGALTWGAAKKWYGFPRTPFDVTFLPRRDAAALARITDRTAAVIVEPIQGVGGAGLRSRRRIPARAAQALR